MFDLATRTAEGIANTFDFLEESRGDGSESDRVRPPRMMHGPDKSVRPYSRSEAIAQRVLLQLREGMFAQEALHMCAQLNPGELVVLTSGRLLLASSTTFRTTRQFPLLAIQAVRTHPQRNSLELQLKSGTNRAMTGAPAGERTRWRRLFGFKRAASAAAKMEYSKGSDAGDAADEPVLNSEMSVHFGRVTRFGKWTSFRKLTPAVLAVGLARAAGRNSVRSRSAGSRGSTGSAAQQRGSTGSTIVESALHPSAALNALAMRTQDHEIECPDEATCRALVAALVLVLAPDDQKK